MYESLQALAILLLVWAIGDAIYAFVIKTAVEAAGKHLSKEMTGLFQVGLVLIGSVDLLGASVVALGLVLCFLAVLLDLLEMFSE